MAKFAVILSGSGVYDGSEIHEATMTFLSIIQNNSTYECFAPNMNQHHVINHLTGEVMAETRNILVESARIARGKIHSLEDFDATNFDAVIFPGGFGVAKNLSNYAFEGENCTVNPQVEAIIVEMHKQNKPIGALCISPVIIAKTLSTTTLTIGNDEETAAVISKMGASHVNTTYGEVIADKKNKIFTTPCYMLDSTIDDIYEGTSNLIKSILENL